MADLLEYTGYFVVSVYGKRYCSNFDEAINYCDYLTAYMVDYVLIDAWTGASVP